jgi:hypothetical protein
MHYGISGEGRAVNDNRVLGCNQWRGRSVSIPRVPLFYVSQKARETNTLTHALQLKQTSLRSGLCARRQEDFKGRIGEHHCSHIATIGNEPRESRQFTLPQQKRLTGFNMYRHLGRTAPPCLGSDYGRHITVA